MERAPNGASWFQYENCLVDGGGSFQVNCLPLARDNSLPYLGGSPLQFGHLVSVEDFLQAGRAVCAMFRFKTAMQAVMTMPSVAVAVARLLVDHPWNFGREQVGMPLHGLVFSRHYIHLI